jgi:hypothetical protein
LNVNTEQRLAFGQGAVLRLINTWVNMISVLPPFPGLPLIAGTYIFVSLILGRLNILKIPL